MFNVKFTDGREVTRLNEAEAEEEIRSLYPHCEAKDKDGKRLFSHRVTYGPGDVRVEPCGEITKVK